MFNGDKTQHLLMNSEFATYTFVDGRCCCKEALHFLERGVSLLHGMQMAFDRVHGPRIWEGNTRLQNRQEAIIISTKNHSYHNQWKQKISYICYFRFELCCLPVSNKNTAIYIFKMQNLVHNHATFSCSINCSFIRSLIKLRLTLMPMSLADLVLANLILLDRVCKLPFLKPRTIMFVNICLN